ncbi:MAG: hypothetical protein K0B01_07760 [Syntrophobacterales bacterium]|nr:hypothetical protein [Syntrophobacterales bacterium]
MASPGRGEKHTVDYFPFYVKDGRTLFILESKYGCKGTGFFTNMMRFLCQTPDHHFSLADDADRIYFFSKTKCDDEDAGAAMLDLMAKTGKIYAPLWVSYRVIVSPDLLGSLKEAYTKRKNAIITLEEIISHYVQKKATVDIKPISGAGNTDASVFPAPEIQPDGHGGVLAGPGRVNGTPSAQENLILEPEKTIYSSLKTISDVQKNTKVDIKPISGAGNTDASVFPGPEIQPDEHGGVLAGPGRVNDTFLGQKNLILEPEKTIFPSLKTISDVQKNTKVDIKPISGAGNTDASVFPAPEIHKEKKRKENIISSKEEIVGTLAHSDPLALLQKEIVSAYHEILPMLPKVTKWTHSRRTHLAVCLKDKSRQSVDWWKSYFIKVRGSPFLTGENDRGWKSDLEWLTKESNLIKVMEEKYDRHAISKCSYTAGAGTLVPATSDSSPYPVDYTF